MLLFKGIPDTKSYEDVQIALRNAYNKLIEIEKSDDYKEYLTLKERVHSKDFKLKVNEIKNLKFKGSPEFKTEKEYKKLQKDAGIKKYLKTVENKTVERYQKIETGDKLQEYNTEKEYLASKAYNDEVKYMKLSAKKKFRQSDEYNAVLEFNKLKKSASVKNYLKKKKKGKEKDVDLKGEVEAYLEFESIITSKEFLQNKQTIEGQKLENSEAYKRKKHFEQLSKDPDIVFYQKFGKSKDLKNYQAVVNSEKLKRYFQLEKELASDSFIKQKEYLMLSGTKKYELSDLYKDEMRFGELSKADNIIFYLKNKGHKKYRWFETWKLTFSDDFESKKLEEDNWMTKYFWGEAMLQESYSLSNESQVFTDKNFKFSGKSISIETRKEESEGKQWNENFGFVTKVLPYSSGLISTGNSFRQKYGTFEAKVRFTQPDKVTHAFWFVGENMLPHINVFSTQSKLELGNYWGELDDKNQSPKSVKQLSYNKLKSDFQIYRIVWDEKQIEWQINGTTVFKSKKGIPNDAMYLVFSSHVFDENCQVQQAEMEIEWVRCYASKS